MSSREEAAADKAAAAADGKNLGRALNEYDVVIEEILGLGCGHSLTEIFLAHGFSEIGTVIWSQY